MFVKNSIISPAERMMVHDIITSPDVAGIAGWVHPAWNDTVHKTTYFRLEEKINPSIGSVTAKCVIANIPGIYHITWNFRNLGKQDRPPPEQLTKVI